MLKNRSLRVGSGEERNGVTGWKSISEKDLSIAFSRSEMMLILWGLSKKMFQELLSG